MNADPTAGHVAERDAACQLRAARAALLADGYFTAGQVSGDIAPRITERLTALHAERDEALAALAAAAGRERGTRPALTAERKTDARKLLADGGCEFCSGLHAAQGVACPRVKSFRRDSATMVTEAEYWPHGQWPEDNILWPEDIAEDDDGTSTG